MTGDLELDELSMTDLDDLLSLTHAVGWQFSAEQMAALLDAGRFFGHRRKNAINESHYTDYANRTNSTNHIHPTTRHNTVISSAGLFPYGPELSALGIVIVHPDAQRQGLGHQVVEACLSDRDAGHSVLLVATEMGLPLYQSFGFNTVDTLARMVLSSEANSLLLSNGDNSLLLPSESNSLDSHAANPSAKDSSQSSLERAGLRIEDLHPRHFEAMLEIDRKLFGGDRSRVYRSLWKHGVTGKVAYSGATVVGFTLLNWKGDTLVINALMALEEAIALELLRSISPSGTRRDQSRIGTIRIDVPWQQTTFLKRLTEMGFVEARSSPIMVRGDADIRGYRQGIYSILDAALG